jgi:hypothetical protein
MKVVLGPLDVVSTVIVLQSSLVQIELSFKLSDPAGFMDVSSYPVTVKH